jgi:NAD(P)-dependent dehydrogenase (short-subunit alcohol dehydrogenase family)
MCRRGSGSIINIASIAGLRPQFEGMLYSMTKAALIMMTQSYALELGPKGVRVNAIAPGLIQTDFAKALWDNPQIRAAQESKAALKRIGQPDDIGGVAVFLASKAGNFVCGQTIIADGGVIGTGAE